MRDFVFLVSCSLYSFRLSAFSYLRKVGFVYPFLTVSAVATNISRNRQSGKDSVTDHNVVSRAVCGNGSINADYITVLAFRTNSALFHKHLKNEKLGQGSVWRQT
jgi:hypothetical protein